MSEIDFLIGQTVVEVRDEDRIVFEAGKEAEPSLYADVGRVVCLDRDGKRLALIELVGRAISQVSTAAGTLLVTFADGATMRTHPDPDHEAWQIVGGTPHSLVVCLPGGELAVWDR